ncbi:4-oxalocrotonate tautomerase [Pseudomonas taiwanensis]|uniref:tautomerase family protein n=1 Tax=Pseudomonas TaxID=286 RepID=UPI0015BB0553|nr:MULTISPECIES: tautomerase family protein [Pseudomonas]MDH4564384.1 4-oxalocrotonate tautomerase [Pseudomonas sp. BN411]MDH4653746.1 4-oxalocrotonate tautomerase [Pseudomonas sp. BN606]MDH4874096.1 4-oxalocrotonate tautomerase [Pseudomonas sp. BN515]NWL75728.1 4-oxalocrotonate tautomerase [Pseudomonas taiwanensis]
MPIVNFHLLAGESTGEQCELLLVEASQLYAKVLQSPIERVRAFITWHDSRHFAAAGSLCAATGMHAPFFDFFVLDGRSVEQRHQLAEGFTELLVKHLAVRRDVVRGRCQRIAPEDWSIAGVPASLQRADELAVRAAGEPAHGP